jgi:6-pyruvoyltetrahydropterin/6-carboxytetrahydropterin synthase
MYQVIKRITFCYAHRLLGHEGLCQYLHGHNGVAEIVLEEAERDELGMVCDFSIVKERMQSWITKHMDHQTLLKRSDPLVHILQEADQPLYLMDENPTAESMAAVIFGVAKQEGLSVQEVRLWETPTACAVYKEEISR